MTKARENATQGGMTQLVNLYSPSTTAFTVDNVFSSTYQNYKVLLNITDLSANVTLNWVFRSSAPADISTNYNAVAFMAYNTSTGVSSFGGGTTQLGFTTLSSSAVNANNFYDLSIGNTNSTVKYVTGVQAGGTASFGGQIGVSTIFLRNDNATPAAGFKLTFTGGTATASLRVYGVRNS